MTLSKGEIEDRVIACVTAAEQSLKALSNSVYARDYQLREFVKLKDKFWLAYNRDKRGMYGCDDTSLSTSCFESGDLFGYALMETVSNIRSHQKRDQEDLLTGRFWVYHRQFFSLKRFIKPSIIVDLMDVANDFFFVLQKQSGEKDTYKQNLQEEFSKLKALVFDYIRNDQTILKGYLVYQIVNKCIDKYNDDCPLNKFIRNNNLHHALVNYEPIPIIELAATWTNIQFLDTREMDLRQRAKIILTLCSTYSTFYCYTRDAKKYLADIITEADLNDIVVWGKSIVDKERAKHNTCKAIEEEYKYCSLTDELKRLRDEETN